MSWPAGVFFPCRTNKAISMSGFVSENRENEIKRESKREVIPLFVVEC